MGWMQEPSNTIMGQSYAEQRKAGTSKNFSQEEYILNHLGLMDLPSPARRKAANPAGGLSMTGTTTKFGRSASSPSLRTCEPAGGSFLMMAELIDQDLPLSRFDKTSASWPPSPSSRVSKASGARSATSSPVVAERTHKRPHTVGQELTATIDFSDILSEFGDAHAQSSTGRARRPGAAAFGAGGQCEVRAPSGSDLRRAPRRSSRKGSASRCQ